MSQSGQPHTQADQGGQRPPEAKPEQGPAPDPEVTTGPDAHGTPGGPERSYGDRPANASRQPGKDERRNRAV